MTGRRAKLLEAAETSTAAAELALRGARERKAGEHAKAIATMLGVIALELHALTLTVEATMLEDE